MTAREEAIEIVNFSGNWDLRSSEFPDRAFDFGASSLAAGKIDSLGELPLAVVSRGRTDHWVGVGPDKLEIYQEMWMELQEELAALSTDSTLITAEACSQDDILSDCAELVAGAITDMVAKVRGE